MSAELLTSHEFHDRMKKGNQPVIHRFVLFFPRTPARWTAPSFRAITNKSGELARNPKTGHAVLARFKKGKAGKEEIAWKLEVHDTVRKLRLPWADPWMFSIRLWIVVLYPTPKSMPKKHRHSQQAKNTAPDLQNIQRPIEDALQGAIYKSDSIVSDCRAQKWYAAEGQRPGTYIMIDYLPPWAREITP